MALPTPKLDDRAFQDIVREARSKIPVYCPTWTDYNLSDPGVTLIELFAWMTDMLLYRLNRVPEKSYIKFMELIGVRLEPPKSAEVDITFRLSAPQPRVTTIPAGTEVATIRTETEEAINFITRRDLLVLIPKLSYALTSPSEGVYNDVIKALTDQNATVPVFNPVPQENNAFYLGFEEDLASQTLALTVNCKIEGIGVDPRDPPLTWEYWNEEPARWLPLRVETDTTGGLNTPGTIILHIPYESRMKEINGNTACWIRCRAVKPRPDQRAYTTTPNMTTITADGLGGTVPASQCYREAQEVLGRSDGTPGQKFALHNIPLLAREPGETVEVETDEEGIFEPWQEVPDFANSGPEDNHFTLDSTSGEIDFGPVIRQPSGEERRYGRTPANGRQIRFTSYRWGGGTIGNVGENTIVVPKSSVPYIDKVTNFKAARGGVDGETLERAKMRAPQVIRSRTRAVTGEDYECLAMEASPLVARARCLTPGNGEDSPPPGVVRLLLIPRIGEADRFLSLEELEIPRLVREKVQEYLDERRLLATSLELAAPHYQTVSVVARIKVKEMAMAKQVTEEAERRLYRYINPVCGGPDGNGWPFGRTISLSEAYAAVQPTRGLDYVEDIQLFPIDAKTGQRGESVQRITLPKNGVLRSEKHEVIVEESA